MSKKNHLVSASMLALALAAPAAYAATVQDTFGVSATVQADCSIESAAALSFGTVGSLAADVDATSDISVKCTNTTTYDVGLNAGTGVGATVSDRKMTGDGPGTQTLNYTLYQDAGRTTNWGETVLTDTVSGTGDGTAKTHTVYARIPSQTAPEPASYTDTITVTVTY